MSEYRSEGPLRGLDPRIPADAENNALMALFMAAYIVADAFDPGRNPVPPELTARAIGALTGAVHVFSNESSCPEVIELADALELGDPDVRSERLKYHNCDAAGGVSWWENDKEGIPLVRVCSVCRAAKLRTYSADVLTEEQQSGVLPPEYAPRRSPRLSELAANEWVPDERGNFRPVDEA